MVCSSGDRVTGGSFVRSAASRPCPALTTTSSFDPLASLGLDLFFTSILPLLDPPSLASCTAVSRAWRSCSTSDLLWRPLLSRLFALRAHVPLLLLRSPPAPPAYLAFSITMLDAAKVELTPIEMCARVWEMKVKPTCGAYWYSLDPTSRDEDPLLRRFQCDLSVTAMQEKDPIWGGQESTWQFVKAKKSNTKQGGQSVRINSWPCHHVVRLPDGRWRLENYFASYTTCPDQEENKPSYLMGKPTVYCPRCNPEPTEKKSE